MQIGIFCGFSAHTPPARIAEQARAIEGRGFHELWVPEHVVLFEQYESQYPYAEDGRLPGFSGGIMEPFSALAFVAAHTSTIRLGTSICLVPQRNPVYTAKQVADIDFLSGGRFDFGVGIGWLKEEFEALQMPWARRAARVREHLAVMHSLWCDDVSSFEGELYRLPPCVQQPKPVQTPHPPIYFGGEGEPALRRVAEVGQGWLGAGLSPDALPDRLASLARALAAAGRRREDVRVHIMPNRPPSQEDIVRYADLGVQQLVYMVGGRDLDSYLRRLDRLAEMSLA